MNLQMKSKSQNGFTIIELVVVILLLGILAATALPRFMDVTDEAHEAVVDGVAGGLATGSALFRAQWVGRGQPTDGAVPEFGNGTLFSNSRGYPIGLNNVVAVGDCIEIYNNLLQAGRPVVATTEAAYTAANFATATTVSTAVNTVANANTSAQIVAALRAAGTVAESEICDYYYVGQYRTAPASTGVALTLPRISYTFAGTNAGDIEVGSLSYILP